MALVVADVGADQILKAYFNNSFPASKNHKLRLYSNNYTPVDTSVLGNFTEVTGGGYTAISLTNGSWTITVGNDPSDAVYAEQTFTFTGTIGGTGIVYGYYIEDNDGSTGTLVWAELFGTPFTPANNGDNIKVTPKFQMSKGTPS
jgi:hypothetical protein